MAVRAICRAVVWNLCSSRSALLRIVESSVWVQKMLRLFREAVLQSVRNFDTLCADRKMRLVFWAWLRLKSGCGLQPSYLWVTVPAVCLQALLDRSWSGRWWKEPDKLYYTSCIGVRSEEDLKVMAFIWKYSVWSRTVVHVFQTVLQIWTDKIDRLNKFKASRTKTSYISYRSFENGL